jgi:hypothetical protein
MSGATADDGALLIGVREDVDAAGLPDEPEHALTVAELSAATVSKTDAVHLKADPYAWHLQLAQ